MKQVTKCTILLLPFFLISCSSEPDIITAGHGIDQTPSPALKIETQKTNETNNASIKVYLGRTHSLPYFWEKRYINYDVSDVQNGSYAMIRNLVDRNKQAVETSIFFIEDFLTDDKYELETVGVGYDGIMTIWGYYYTDSYDFSTLEIREGYIQYWLVYYDKDNETPIYSIKSKGGSLKMRFYNYASLKFDRYYDGSLSFSNEYY